MKIYISYFYQLRNMSSNILPISTALCWPKWMNIPKGKIIRYQDTLWIGTSLKELSPADTNCNDCAGCSKELAGNCNFTRLYYEHLQSLDFDEVMQKIEKAANYFHCDEVCLMVYEAPTNPCSERAALVKWFAENGIELEEWRKQ